MVGFRVRLSYRTFLFAMGTESKGYEKSRNSMRMQRIHAGIAFAIVERVENSIVKLLAQYWAVPNVSRKMIR